jgi:predicted transcriptional regulator
MYIPISVSEAVELVAKRAKKLKISVSVLCTQAGVSPATITRWKTRNKSYKVSTFLRLMK